MAEVETELNENIILDEEAFDNAVKDFEELGNQLQQLKTNIVELMNILKQGFNTPAGTKFINACEQNLYEPLDEQKIVLEHISGTLRESKELYSSVFKEYGVLQNKIKEIM